MAVFNPSTDFSFTSLPKAWGKRYCKDAPYAAATLTFLNPGIRIVTNSTFSSASQEFTSGILGKGWTLHDSPPAFDMELFFENFTVGSGTSERTAVNFGLQNPPNVRDGGQNHVFVDAIYVRRSKYNNPSPVDNWELFSMSATGADIIHASIPVVSPPTLNGLRLVRTALTSYTAYYWDGSTWQLIGSVTSATRFTSIAHYGEVIIGVGRDTGVGTTHDAQADFKQFTITSGTIAPDVSTLGPSDDFEDSVREDKRFAGWMHNSGLDEQATRIIEGSGYLEFSGSAEPLKGIQWKHALFPGTDISFEASIKQHKTSGTGLGAAMGSTIELINDSQDHGLSVGWTNIGVSWSSDATNSSTASMFVGITGSAAIQIGSTYTIGVESQDSTHVLKLTRVGSLFSAYIDDNLIATLDDATYESNARFLNHPLSPSIYNALGAGTDASRYMRLNYVNITGDYEVRDDVTSPFLTNISPVDGSINVPIDQSISFSIADNVQVDEDTIVIYVNGDQIVTSGIFISEWNTSTITSDITVSGFDILLNHNTDFDYNTLFLIEVLADDTGDNSLDDNFSFTTIVFVPPPEPEPEIFIPDLSQQFNISSIQILGVPKLVNLRNEFDELGNLNSLVRLVGETNWEYRRRIQDSLVHIANSTYQGLVYGITRELGLSLNTGFCINPKTNESGEFLAPDPYIRFDGVWLYLYSDFTNTQLDWKFDRFQQGGNYEHLGDLINKINQTTSFEAGLFSEANQFVKSISVINQSNRGIVKFEKIPQSTKFKLANERLVPGTIIFTNRIVFNTEVELETDVDDIGKYYVDYRNGIVRVYSMPLAADSVRYQYIVYPFCPIYSPIILHDINNENFRVRMFEQVLLNTGEFQNGLLTELGVDIVNELLSIHPMYWGV